MKKIFEKNKENIELIAAGVISVATGFVLGRKMQPKVLEIRKEFTKTIKENKEIIATAVGVTAVVTGVVKGRKMQPKALEFKKEDGGFSFSCNACVSVLVVGGSIYAVKNGIKVYKMYRK